MRTITVNKALLVRTLEANREQHRIDYLAAMERFKIKGVEYLEQQIDVIRTGHLPDRYFTTKLPFPEEFLYDYDLALEMCQWHIGETLDITQDEYRQFVQDDWDWRSSWTSNTTSYLN